jgi:hypothetical protein
MLHGRNWPRTAQSGEYRVTALSEAGHVPLQGAGLLDFLASRGLIEVTRPSAWVRLVLDEAGCGRQVRRPLSAGQIARLGPRLSMK